MNDRNPLCACGCGIEVRIPTNRFILGHAAVRRRLNQIQVDEIRQHLRDGVLAKNAIGRMYGVSGAHICGFDSRRDEGYVPPMVEGVRRAPEIEMGRLIAKSRRMKNQIKKAAKWKTKNRTVQP